MGITNDRLFKPGEVCKLLGVSRATLWAWKNSGKLKPTLVIGNTCRWSEKDLNALANQNDFKTTPKLD